MRERDDYPGFFRSLTEDERAAEAAQEAAFAARTAARLAAAEQVAEATIEADWQGQPTWLVFGRPYETAEEARTAVAEAAAKEALVEAVLSGTAPSDLLDRAARIAARIAPVMRGASREEILTRAACMAVYE